MAILERERRGRTEILTLNRPEARNAMSPELSLALDQAFDELDGDADVLAVVLTGNGPVFCAGADLKVVASGNAAGINAPVGGFGGLAWRDFSKPVIAAVNGAAVAGGFELVLSCDLVVAAEHAVFGLPEVKRGLLAAAGGPIRLAQRVPLPTAIEIVITGDPISAARAYELGLVNRVVPADRVIEEALELADRIARNSPAAIRAGRALVRGCALAGEAAGWELTNELAREVFESGDPIEGATAFAEKRDPVWNS
ncbi:MAG TPA: enoyl-CoA hydratase-related protein [Acidimicrobiia bacterium]|nr:enoyl-CoA hydratase-related protein [Acidimicrobiia bacterium]